MVQAAPAATLKDVGAGGGAGGRHTPAERRMDGGGGPETVDGKDPRAALPMDNSGRVPARGGGDPGRTGER